MKKRFAMAKYANDRPIVTQPMRAQLGLPPALATVAEQRAQSGSLARVRAEDILLAREAPRAISANNILPATVTQVGAGAQAYVQLAMGPARLVARITRASVERLGLAPGIAVFAIVKSVIVDH